MSLFPKTMFEDIKEFHAKFGLGYDGGPRALPPELKPFRTKFMVEELVEYTSLDPRDHKFVQHIFDVFVGVVQTEPSLEKKFDALIDLVYVALGTAYLHGFDFEEGWRRVHEANMKKVRALRSEDSLRGSVYDVVKPPGWTAPDLSDLVQEKPTMFTEYDPDCIPGN